jgi:hypothetical protein
MPEAEMAKFEWVKSDSPIPEIYTNFIHASWSLYDVRVLFGQLKPKFGNDPTFVVEERGAVTISWPHFKEVSKLMHQMVESYEAANGEIKPISLPAAPDSK